MVQSGIELPYAAVRQQIGDSIHFVLHLERSHGRRVVTEFLRIEHYDAHLDKYLMDLVQNEAIHSEVGLGRPPLYPGVTSA